MCIKTWWRARWFLVPAFIISATALALLAMLCLTPAEYHSIDVVMPVQPVLAQHPPPQARIEAPPIKLAPLPQRQRKWWPVVRKLARAEGLDPALVMAVVQVESKFNPRARSSKDAAGMMQIVPETARALGLKDPWNPRENLEAGIRYLAHLKRTFDQDMVMALAAYNAGPTKVSKLGAVPDHEETREFVVKVLSEVQDFRDRFMSLAQR